MAKQGGSKKPGKMDARTRTLIGMVARAVEDPIYWNRISSDDPRVRTELMKRELGRAPTIDDMRALDNAVEMMKRLNDRFGPKPIAS